MLEQFLGGISEEHLDINKVPGQIYTAVLLDGS
jgi:hypothetical protein